MKITDRFMILFSILILALFALAIQAMRERDVVALEGRIQSLHWTEQEAIYGYADMTERLKVGDLVLVTDHDNLESGRCLAVREVRQGYIHLEGRYDRLQEKMIIQEGLDWGFDLARKHTFQPIYQDINDSRFLTNASWFWIQ